MALSRTVKSLSIGAVGVAALGLGAFAIGSAGADAPALRPGDSAIVAEGAEIYAAECAACHGIDLEGQPDWRMRGPDGLLPAPPHDETGHTWHHDGETLFRLTKYGVGGMIGDPDYASAMPAFEDVLTDAEIAAVLSYIKSTWPADIRARHDAIGR